MSLSVLPPSADTQKGEQPADKGRQQIEPEPSPLQAPRRGRDGAAANVTDGAMAALANMLTDASQKLEILALP
jgi:hypothetical protein